MMRTPHAFSIKGLFFSEMPNKNTTRVVCEEWHDEKRDSQAWFVVDSSEESSWVWCQTVIACKMTTIFQRSSFEVLTLAPSLPHGLAVLRTAVHLTAISWLVVCLPWFADWIFEQRWSLPPVQWRDDCKQLASWSIIKFEINRCTFYFGW